MRVIPYQLHSLWSKYIVALVEDIVPPRQAAEVLIAPLLHKHIQGFIVTPCQATEVLIAPLLHKHIQGFIVPPCLATEVLIAPLLHKHIQELIVTPCQTAGVPYKPSRWSRYYANLLKC